MPSRLDKNYFVNKVASELIKSNNCPLCDLNFIKKVDESMIFTVGDYTTDYLEKNGVKPRIEVFDLKTQRGENTYEDKPGSIKIDNPAGYITLSLIKTIERAMISRKRTFIKIQGEEDLAVLPIIFYAPLNSLVVYGIPNIGMGCIIVSLPVKELVNKIFESMEVVE